MKKITKLIKKTLNSRKEKSRLRIVDQIHDSFYIEAAFSAIVIKHNGITIAEFQPGSTQQEILSALEKYRQIAANNHNFD